MTSYSLDSKSGKLTELNRVASGGADPCYVSFDNSGKYLLVANYTGGSIAAFPVAPDGRIGAASAFVQHTGSGPNKERQEGPHAHYIATSADNRFVFAVDLGLDEVLVYRFDPRKGSLTPSNPPFAKLTPGAGPRHLAFHPQGRFAYVLSEVNSTVTAFAYDSKKRLVLNAANAVNNSKRFHRAQRHRGNCCASFRKIPIRIKSRPR